MNARQFAEHVCKTLREAGQQAYLVGGCVRDILLGREPADYDVATDATPDQVQQLFPRSLAVGAQFGVIIVLDDGEATDVARKLKLRRFGRMWATPTGGIRTAWSMRRRRKKMSVGAISRSMH